MMKLLVAVVLVAGFACASDWVELATLGTTATGVSFCKSTKGVAVGGEQVWYTTDSGATWPSFSFNSTPVTYFADAAADATYAVAIGPGDGDSITGTAYSSDCGATWTISSESYPRCNWQDVKPIGTGSSGNFVKTGNWYSLVKGGEGVAISEDGGKTWTTRPWFDGVTAIASSFTSTLNGWTVGGDQSTDIEKTTAILAQTTNRGVSWTLLVNNSAVGYFTDIYFVDASYGWTLTHVPAVGSTYAYSVISMTTDGGKTWTEQVKTPKVALKSLYMVSKTEGWAVGGYEDGIYYHAQFLHTTDGGASWLSFEKRGYLVNSVSGLDSTHVYATATREMSFAGVVLQWSP
ncbi:hypothetical protein Pelo_3449 [Pelomyxa schiedti]|nr:hypothetical protein Pelo_3449 [Pelomyxa schiedti]